MTALVICQACQLGDHSRHVRVVEALTDRQIAQGFCGGKICLCKGECEANGD